MTMRIRRNEARGLYVSGSAFPDLAILFSDVKLNSHVVRFGVCRGQQQDSNRYAETTSRTEGSFSQEQAKWTTTEYTDMNYR